MAFGPMLGEIGRDVLREITATASGGVAWGGAGRPAFLQCGAASSVTGLSFAHVSAVAAATVDMAIRTGAMPFL
jgi:TRAP-type uncharacterized transport system fused permease subunit